MPWRIPASAGDTLPLSPAHVLLSARLPWTLVAISVLVHALLLAVPLQAPLLAASAHPSLAVRIGVAEDNGAALAAREESVPMTSVQSTARPAQAAPANATATPRTLPMPLADSASLPATPAPDASNVTRTQDPGTTTVAGNGDDARVPVDSATTSTQELQLLCPQGRAPAYPALARRHGERGHVLLEVVVEADGQVSASRIASSSGSTRLDNAALTAIRDWHCRAATRNGLPVRTVALQAFEFSLN